MITAAQTEALRSFYLSALASGHIFPAAAACEAVDETTWGTSGLYRAGHNIFGTKQHKHPIFGTVNLPTREFLHHAWTVENDDFISYPQDADAFTDRMATLTRLAANYPHYAAALAAGTPEQYLTEVSRTWSTDPNRAATCIGILHNQADVLGGIDKTHRK